MHPKSADELALQSSSGAGEPLVELGIDFRVIEQGEVADTLDDALVLFWESQRPRRIGVFSQGAIDGNQAIAEMLGGENCALLS
jgi:hypothetical protein